jgi:hypothetical protein
VDRIVDARRVRGAASRDVATPHPARTNVRATFSRKGRREKYAIFGAAKKDDGTLEANRVDVGRDGITPPM